MPGPPAAAARRGLLLAGGIGARRAATISRRSPDRCALRSRSRAVRERGSAGGRLKPPRRQRQLLAERGGAKQEKENRCGQLERRRRSAPRLERRRDQAPGVQRGLRAEGGPVRARHASKREADGRGGAPLVRPAAHRSAAPPRARARHKRRGAARCGRNRPARTGRPARLRESRARSSPACPPARSGPPGRRRRGASGAIIGRSAFGPTIRRIAGRPDPSRSPASWPSRRHGRGPNSCRRPGSRAGK